MKRSIKFIPKVTTEDATEIIEINRMFTSGNHELLRGLTLQKKYKDRLYTLYYKYFNKVDHYDWSLSLLEMELKNLKNDPFCKDNSNKKYWSMSILLGWLCDLPTNITQKDLYHALSSRESYQRVLKFAYWK